MKGGSFEPPFLLPHFGKGHHFFSACFLSFMSIFFTLSTQSLRKENSLIVTPPSPRALRLLCVAKHRYLREIFLSYARRDDAKFMQRKSID